MYMDYNRIYMFKSKTNRHIIGQVQNGTITIIRIAIYNDIHQRRLKKFWIDQWDQELLENQIENKTDLKPE